MSENDVLLPCVFMKIPVIKILQFQKTEQILKKWLTK